MYETINANIIAAMKSKDTETLSTLRMLKGAIQLEEINKRIKLSDEDIVTIVFKQIKMRKDSNIEFEKGNRLDLIDKNNIEIDILNKYLPVQLTDEELNSIIDNAINTVNAKVQSDIGKIMAVLMPEIKGKTDISKVSAIIKNKLI